MTRGALVDIVVKVGGGLLASPGHLDAVLAELADAASTRRLLVIPGGGPFADAVREVDRRLTLSDDAAHWMAVLAMDQYAHLLVSRCDGWALRTPQDCRPSINARAVARAVARLLDTIPAASWDFTSDASRFGRGRIRARARSCESSWGSGPSVDPFFIACYA